MKFFFAEPSYRGPAAGVSYAIGSNNNMNTICKWMWEFKYWL